MGKGTLAALMMLAAVPAAFAADGVTVPRPVAFNEDAEIPKAVRAECKLDEELPDAIAATAKEGGVPVTFAPQVTSATTGRALELEITDVAADGNGFIGHRKSMSVRGKLYDNGQVVGSFKARRTSMGGAFGGFKGNCSVLSRTVNAIGEDIGGWLAAPKMDSRLGDLE